MAELPVAREGIRLTDAAVAADHPPASAGPRSPYNAHWDATVSDASQKPRVIDPELVRQKLADLDQHLVQVSEYREITAEDYLRDWKLQRIVERTLEMAIETCVDIAMHVITEHGLRVPSTYSEAFEALGQTELLDADMRAVTVRLAGFSNVVVHEYARGDGAMVVGIMADLVDDLTRFKAAALGWT
jgi:uncharacterized protein YutE (UPF0331/DUF86 family)